MSGTRISSLCGWIILIVIVGCSLSTQGNTIHVKVGGTGDGSSWINAYGDLQTALDDAEPILPVLMLEIHQVTTLT